MKKPHFIWFILFWVSLIVASLIWNRSLILKNSQELVLNKSQAFFDHIVTTRQWNAEHGGVYVPVTKKTQPNIYLEDSLRDVVTMDGISLTKINPAYMTRQISEINNEKYEIRFHITSLNPIRPANKPDQWERSALESFHNKTKDVLQLVAHDDHTDYRYMAPLITQESCLRCHASQGYKLGDIRGGISVSFSSEIYQKSTQKQIYSLSLIHFLVLIIGIIGLILYSRMSNKYLRLIQLKNTELEQINITKDKFFSIIAHDLRSPLSALIAFGQVLLERHKNIPADYREVLINNINESSKKTFNLLTNLLQWAKSESGRLSIKPTDLILHDIVLKNLLLQQEFFDAKNLELKNNIDDSLHVFADRNMLDTVVRNLLSNALKFTPESGLITINAKKTSDAIIEISICDTGVGMPETVLDKLFDTHSLYTTRGTNSEGGTGLGLKLCKEFIEKNGGQIWVESKVGEGTVFSFTLPEVPNGMMN